jgi:hypothetical protein
MFDVCTTGESDAHRIDVCTTGESDAHRIDVCRVTCGAHIEHLQLPKQTFSVFLWLRKIPLR